MLTRHAACLVRVCTLLALVLLVLPGHVAAAPPTQGTSSHLMIYHELTQRPDESPKIDSLVLSGDGRRAIWAESPMDPKVSNRVFALDVDGGQPRGIDAYAPICQCRTQVDVSDDGNTVVSTEGVRIRILSGGATFGRKREVLRLANDVIRALRISGDGRIIVFVVLRDTSISEPDPRKRGAPIPRGIWAVSAEGGEPLQLAGIREVAAVAGVPVAELESYPDFGHDTWTHAYALDVSDDGRRIIFGARAGTAGQGVFSITEGTLLTKLVGPVEDVYQVAVSGDGQTVAFATTGQRGLNVSVSAGGTLKTVPNFDFDFDFDLRFYDRLQLNRDGTKLLGKEQLDSVLVDVATLAKHQLIPSAITEGHLFTGGTASYATMNTAGTRVLYLANPHRKNLVVIDLGATDLVGAPLVRGLHVDPDTIPVDGSKSASVSAEISWDGTLLPVWLEILLEGELDRSISGKTYVGMTELQDTVDPDPGRLQGIFAADLTHDTREREKTILGPRNLRLIIESRAADGRHHGTVFDADKRLTVGGIELGSHYNGEVAVGDAQIAARLTDPPGDFKGLRDVRATIQLDPTTNALLGGSLSYVAFMDDPSLPRRHEFSAATARSAGPFTVLPGGILGTVIFQGELTIYDSDGSVFLGPIEAEQDFHYADDPSGQVVLCATGRTLWTLEEAEVARQACVDNAFIALKPVQTAPPVAGQVPA